jgi:hypothetical protein
MVRSRGRGDHVAERSEQPKGDGHEEGQRWDARGFLGHVAFIRVLALHIHPVLPVVPGSAADLPPQCTAQQS